MGWKKVALMGCAAPALTGCNIWQMTGHNLLNEPHVVHTQWSLECESRSNAKAAWKEVRECFPRRMFTADFHDGFEEGFADYLARGGNAQPPAVPPLKYTRNKKYYSPEGQCLIRDYMLGFKYGIDVAIATGQRKFFTVPVLLPEKHAGPTAFNVQPTGKDQPLGEATDPNSGALPTPPEASKPTLGTPTPLPTPPNPSTPETAPPPKVTAPMPESVPPKVPATPKPVDNLPKLPDNLPKPGGTPKISTPWNSPATIPAVPPVSAATPAPTRRATVSAPRPPVPRPGYGATANTLPAPPKTDNAVQPAAFSITLPEPPAEVPTLPAHVPTPPIHDDLPVLPANHLVPPPLPANHYVPPPLPTMQSR